MSTDDSGGGADSRGNSAGESCAGEPADAVERVYAPTDGAHAEPLARASAAFVRGDFREVRALCRGVGEDGTEDERKFAADLLSRTAVDPMALGVVAALLVVIVGLFVWAY